MIMYICPTCSKSFKEEYMISRHFLSCWKEKYPNHTSKDAPHSETKVSHKINNDMFNFFAALNKKGEQE